MHAIETENISLKVDLFHLNNISLTIPSKKITSIVGPNGSGKSTLLKIISRLIHQDSGNVFIDNKEANKFKSKEFAQTIAMLPQSKGMLPNISVKELIAFGREPYKTFFSNRLNEEDEIIIQEAMEMTRTTKHKDRLFYNLSGGEQQKVRIAMALVQQTNIVLLDEPTTYLDISHQYELMEMLQQINETQQKTIIMVLHDLQQAAIYSDYMIAMKQGKIVQTGSPDGLLTCEFLHDVYEMNARVLFEDGYPLIIPNCKRNKRNLCYQYNEG